MSITHKKPFDTAAKAFKPETIKKVFDFAFDMVKSRHPIWLEKNPKAKYIKKSFINLDPSWSFTIVGG
mgnify:CR=1 FL=1